MSENTKKPDVHPVIGFFGSFGLAAVLLIMLFFLTLAGTLENNFGTNLYMVQKKYYDSIIGFHGIEVFGFYARIPFPGGMLLMGLLCINLLVGGMMRMRRSWSLVGVYIAHVGILFMLIAGLVRFLAAEEGSMTLSNDDIANKSGNYSESYYDWEIAISEKLDDNGKVREYIIPTDLLRLRPRDQRTFKREGLPFELTVRGYLSNSKPVRASDGSEGVVDGVALVPLEPPRTEQSRAIPGAYVSLKDSNGQTRDTVLWGNQRAGWVTRSGGRDYSIDLRRKRNYLPFTIVIEEFTPTFYPGTRMAKSFESKVERIDDGRSQGEKVLISMNQPMRTNNFVVYQSEVGAAECASR